ncbi:MAG: hypothetical protein J6K48_10130 [Lachnospiraceae bacterium]|nr:hypothetical protein [Lachnospiraceae bacterium]
MYLSLLKEEQKRVFLELAYEMAFLDNDFGEKEQFMIESYCNEMQINVPPVIRARSMAEIIETIKEEWEGREKKIVLFEIIGLAMIDGNYDEKERKSIVSMTEIFGLQDKFRDECEILLKEYVEMYGKMNTLVLG